MSTDIVAKHTPGPWGVEATSMGTIEAADGRVVAQAFQVRPMREDMKQLERKANAHLIAAAPELLAALESVWLWMKGQAQAQSKGGHATFDLMMLRDQRDRVGTAIAYATGAQS